jgi:hypothetical protein
MTGNAEREEDDLQHETLIALPVGRMNELEEAKGVALERDGVGGKKLGWVRCGTYENDSVPSPRQGPQE